MSNKVPKDALKELQNIVGGHPGGISAPDIAKSLSEAIPRRTLQYRLKQLVEVGLLRMAGSGRWAKYHLATSGRDAADESAQQDDDYGRLIRLSKEGKEVRDYIQQPTGARKPVGYNIDFLNQYAPNVSRQHQWHRFELVM